jgi:hypothetical protein
VDGLQVRQIHRRNNLYLGTGGRVEWNWLKLGG